MEHNIKIIHNGNKIKIQCSLRVLILLFGTPHYSNVLREKLYSWKDINTEIWNNGFGFYEVVSNNNGIKKFIATLLLNIESHNRKIKELYRINNKNEWETLLHYYQFELIDWVKTVNIGEESWNMMDLVWINDSTQ